MEQFFDFVIRHWELWLAFFVLLIIVIVFELRNKLTGIPQVSPHQATLLINREDALMLDLRDNGSFNKGHVINALNIPYANLNDNSKQLNKYKGKPIILILNTGQQPSKIQVLLQQIGFAKIYTLNGGIAAWQNAGLPLTK